MVIDDPGTIVDMHSFLEGKTEYLNRKLDYRVFLTPSGCHDRLEVFVELPHYYPAIELPTVTVSYPNISTQQHNQLKTLVDDALRDLQQTEETFLFQFISWIQDAESVRKVLLNEDVASQSVKVPYPVRAEKLERLWIYSHHIKNKRKRTTIIDTARTLGLT